MPVISFLQTTDLGRFLDKNVKKYIAQYKNSLYSDGLARPVVLPYCLLMLPILPISMPRSAIRTIVRSTKITRLLPAPTRPAMRLATP